MTRTKKAPIRIKVTPFKKLVSPIAKRLEKLAKPKVIKSAAKKIAKAISSRVKDLTKKRLQLLPKQAEKELALFRSAKLTVGIHGTEGAQPVEGSPYTVAQIMAVHEFGSPSQGIPVRSWLRAWFDAEEAQVARLLRESAVLVAKGRLRAKTALNRVGIVCVGMIQKRWADGIGPPLKPATVSRKRGGTKQLIDSGQSRASVSYVVTFEGA